MSGWLLFGVGILWPCLDESIARATYVFSVNGRVHSLEGVYFLPSPDESIPETGGAAAFLPTLEESTPDD